MYNKIFTKILDSSIWLESNPTRIVWFTFLAAMDEDGFAQFASIANLAHRARVTMEEAQAALDCLTAPDANSSDPDNEGRRIERVPGGWMVLNSGKYKEMVTRAVAQIKTRARVARFRAGKQPVTLGNANVTPCNGEKQSVTPARKKKRSVTPSESDSYSASVSESTKPPEAAVKPPRERNLLMDTLATLESGTCEGLTTEDGSRHAAAIRIMKSGLVDVTPEEIKRRAQNYAILYPNIRFTSNGLAKHWTTCNTRPEPTLFNNSHAVRPPVNGDAYANQ